MGRIVAKLSDGITAGTDALRRESTMAICRTLERHWKPGLSLRLFLEDAKVRRKGERGGSGPLNVRAMLYNSFAKISK